MTQRVDADVVILGGGCAGLALAARLASIGSPRSVVVVESRTDYSDDRSWCFWAPHGHEFDELVSMSWPAWTFSDAAGRSIRHSVTGLSYHYVRGIDFYRHALGRIASSSRVRLESGVQAHRLTAEPRAVTVDTDAGALVARHVIDTRPRPTPALLYQSFTGREIETNAELPFSLDRVDLMGSMSADEVGLRFAYTLPLSPTRALVEWTRFSASPIRPADLVAELDRYISAAGVTGERTVRTEAGVLGMGLVSHPESGVPGVHLAGAAGGGLRAASGYGFLRIQRWARACAERLAAGDAPIGHPREPVARRTMDRLFLQAVRARPESTADYFMALAAGVAPAALVRFLSDGARPGDYARIIASLPLAPFIRELVAPPPVIHRLQEARR